MKKIISLAEVLDDLSRIPRTGGVLFAGINPAYGDSLSDHSYKVTYLSLLFGKFAQKNNIELNLEHLLVASITHDWCETIVLDIPSSSPSYQTYFSNINLKQEVKKAEAKADQTIEAFLGGDIELKINSGLTETEQAILSAADVTALLMEALEWKYQNLQYEWIDYLWSNTIKRLETVLNDKLPFMSNLVDELQQRYTRGTKAPNPFLTKPEFQTRKSDVGN